MKPTELLQEVRKMRFEESFSIWTEGRISQENAARKDAAERRIPL